ncbi:MAG: zf-HC2 domain-containing protein [Acidobacteriota bacterium]|nr:zf-HC2 domain-containing protein [Acidobacteriota bacterium]
MNCEDFLMMLDGYVENELDGKSAVQVSMHITDCPACAGEYEVLRREQQVYSQYLLDVEATPALWANVQADIEKIQRERFSSSNFRDWFAKTFGVSAFNPAFAAAPVVLLITLGIIVGLIKYKSAENSFGKETVSQKTNVQSLPEKTDDAKNEVSINDKKDDVSKSKDKTTIAQAVNRVKRNISRSNLSKPTNQFVSSKPVNPNRKLTTDEIVEKAERQYKGAIAILASDIKRRRAQTSPNFISQFEQPLADIDRTINETRRAVRAQPNDAAAVQYMTTAYAKKIELLRAIAGN